MISEDLILRTANLKTYFPIRSGFNPFKRSEQRYVRAVDSVSISIPSGKTVAVVGESGCGKSTLARTIARLTAPTSGEIYFDGKRIDNGQVSHKVIYRNMQMVFQDPDSTLDPQMKIENSIGEPLRGLMDYSNAEVKESVQESLAAVGLSSDFADRLPRQLSGGQKQRIAIARAISTHPKFVILDEPTSALDASVQAQILTLLVDLQKKFNLSYMLITHNIAVAKYLADTIAVMYSGNIVEYGPALTVVDKPRHPYTIALISSAPIPDPWRRNLLQTEIRGEVPSVIDPPAGCKFNPRCSYAEGICTKQSPPLEEISPSHLVACHFVEKTKMPQ
jgi:peptide/nickel transport system ATP-binding protein